MARRIGTWQVAAAALVSAACAGLAAAAETGFSPNGDRSRAVLEGNWQSCRGADGHYGERVYDNNIPGVGPFELHLGPYHDFALFVGVQDAHREHGSPENLLRPFTVEVRANRARQSWQAAGLVFDVQLAGGGDEQCESWYITLRQARPGSSD